jgi:CRISPR-associated endonuclease Cas1
VQRQGSIEPDPLPISKNGLIVAEGFGLRLYVRRGMLQIEDGEGANGRRIHLVRASSKGKRIVFLGRAGSISVEAFRWMADAGVSFALVDAAAGRVIVSSFGYRTDLPTLRRQQVLAGIDGAPVGLEVARYLLGAKLAGQRDVLEHHFPTDQGERALAVLRFAEEQVADVSTLASLRGLESRAASAYWSAWSGEEIRFDRSDARRIPEHWRSFNSRSSELSSGPRLATCPLNALLNYLAALGEIESTLALLTVGADPSLGIIHADQPSRSSLSLDLVEAIRPDLERWVLELVRAREFRRQDFYETRRGVFRVGPDLAREVAESMPRWRRSVAPHAEQVARLIARSGRRPVRLPTPLTEANRSAGRRSQGSLVGTPRFPLRTPKACKGCGVVLVDRRRTWCDECLPEARAKQSCDFVAAGLAAKARMRARGQDPGHTDEARRRRSMTATRRRAEQAAWTGESGNCEFFREQILPGLRSLPLLKIVGATGLSISYAHLIKAGRRVPHHRWWPVLRDLANSQ